MEKKENNIRFYFEVFIILAILLAPFFYFQHKNNINKLQKDKENFLKDEINLSKEPLQIPFRTNKALDYYDHYGRWGKNYKLYPLALYKISGVVIAKKITKDGWPINLGLAWKEAAKPENLKLCTFYSDGAALITKCSSYSRHFLKTKQKGLNKYSKKIKMQNMRSHNHIFPANQEIYNTLARLNYGQKIMLKGYLIIIEDIHPYTKKKYTLVESSLRRDDTEYGYLDIRKNHEGKIGFNASSGACEILYVNKVIIE